LIRIEIAENVSDFSATAPHKVSLCGVAEYIEGGNMTVLDGTIEQESTEDS
jgi:hypothetical protein